MSDFAASWLLSRTRFLAEITGLNMEQLNWRIYPGALTIGEMALHVAGVEASFGSQLDGRPLDKRGQKIMRSATEGVVDDQPFPFASAEITPDVVMGTLEYSRAIWEPLITAAEPDVRQKTIKSALGPMISGEGAFARLGFHAGYHQGQAYMIKCAPGFPK
jgi:hypothetical protein